MSRGQEGNDIARLECPAVRLARRWSDGRSHSRHSDEAGRNLNLRAPRIAAKRTVRRSAGREAGAARHRGPGGYYRSGLTSLPGTMPAEDRRADRRPAPIPGRGLGCSRKARPPRRDELRYGSLRSPTLRSSPRGGPHGCSGEPIRKTPAPYFPTSCEAKALHPMRRVTAGELGTSQEANTRASSSRCSDAEARVTL